MEITNYIEAPYPMKGVSKGVSRNHGWTEAVDSFVLKELSAPNAQRFISLAAKQIRALTSQETRLQYKGYKITDTSTDNQHFWMALASKGLLPTTKNVHFYPQISRAGTQRLCRFTLEASYIGLILIHKLESGNNLIAQAYSRALIELSRSLSQGLKNPCSGVFGPEGERKALLDALEAEAVVQVDKVFTVQVYEVNSNGVLKDQQIFMGKELQAIVGPDIITRWKEDKPPYFAVAMLRKTAIRAFIRSRYPDLHELIDTDPVDLEVVEEPEMAGIQAGQAVWSTAPRHESMVADNERTTERGTALTEDTKYVSDERG